MKKPVIKKIIQVGIIVKNVEEKIKNFKEIYGVDEWVVCVGDPSCVKNMMCFGKKVDFAAKLAMAKIGEVELELIEPLDDKGVYAKHLREHGEGIHHLGIKEDKEVLETIIKDRNFPLINYGDWEGLGEYKYYDTTSDLGFIIEIFEWDK